MISRKFLNLKLKYRTYCDLSFARDVNVLNDFIKSQKNIVVITGAGCSTESGIPDYRGKNGTYVVNPNYKPITYQHFIAKPDNRQRYWYRSMIGWPLISSKEPSRAHKALFELQKMGKVSHIITQNVDRLHHKVISNDHSSHLDNITELHGSLYEVVCLQCSQVSDRHEVQNFLISSNPHFDISREVASFKVIRPDGDTETSQLDFTSYVVPQCLACKAADAVMKPNVVFFGENVPVKKVEKTFDIVEKADALLVVGSTLSVYSSWRFVKKAIERGIPICIVNQGETRADAVATFKIEQNAGDVFEKIIMDLKS
jgi:NAD-dependent deacetylase sirtuin 4